MSSYKEIVGQKITKVSSDPGEPKTGQMWYNSTTGTLRGLGIVSAWASGSPLITAKNSLGGAGTQTAAIIFGGVPALTATEEYNGSGFGVGGNLNTGRSYMAGCGTQTAGLGFGGYTTSPNTQGQALTEEYDGSSWTAGGTANTSRYSAGAAGIQTAAVIFGGYNNGLPPGNVTNATEEYNGSSWTTSPGTLGTARYELAGAGLQTAAIAALGYKYGSPLRTTATEEYDGSTWTAGGSATTERSALKGGGIQTSFLVFGGFAPPDSAATEAYDGTSWSNQPSLATARRRPGAASNTPGSTTGLCAGGQTPSATSATEEFTSSTNTITAAAWAAGATYPVALNQLGGSGTQTAGLCFGGNVNTPNPNGSNQTNEYDGSSWTAGGNLNQSKNTGSRSGVGTQTATMCINFRNDGTSTPVTPIPPANFNYAALTNVEEYDGSSWTAGTATPDGEVEAGTCGTVSAALRFGGNPGNPPAGPATNSTIYWNDSSWTSLNNMSTARYGLAPAFQGTYNAALGFGGETPPPANVASTEEFDGTNWTAGGNLVSTAFRHSGSGTQTAALSFGGSPSIAQTEGYDGTAWSTRPSLANGRSFGGGAGSSTAALYMCGDTTTHVEEFTGETTAANITDFTTS